MSAQSTPGPLPLMPLKVFNAAGTTAILDAHGNEVVGWMGFDDSNRTRAQHAGFARHIVQCVNAHDDMLAALRALLAEVTTPQQQWVEGSAVNRARAVIAKATGSAT